MRTITHSVKLKLKFDLQEAKLLVKHFTSACNHVSNIAFNSAKRPHNSIEVIKLTYTSLREDLGLGAQISQTIGRVVAGKYQSAKSNKHEVKQAVKFEKEWVQYQYNRDWSLKENSRLVSIWTPSGRRKVKYSCEPEK